MYCIDVLSKHSVAIIQTTDLCGYFSSSKAGINTIVICEIWFGNCPGQKHLPHLHINNAGLSLKCKYFRKGNIKWLQFTFKLVNKINYAVLGGSGTSFDERGGGVYALLPEEKE